jgi:adsorption protein B
VQTIGQIPAWTLILGCLAVILLLSGLDDLIPALTCLWKCLRKTASLPAPAGNDREQHGRSIAIFVPCWKEAGVIAEMIRHNQAAIRYRNYDFFLGVYPNDVPTTEVARELAQGFRNVHVAICPHPGPTSKADCLNWIFRRLSEYEGETGAWFDTIVLHDAEDLIHPEALSIIDAERQRFEMVQVPVLPLPTPFGDLTHGVYCDDFAEFQIIDMRARQTSRSFIPSNGVGTGFSRAILDRLWAERRGIIFNPGSLTEDYEIGVYVHTAGLSQTFVPLQCGDDGLIATREYFPRTVRSAIRQRTRWVTGIALQSWERDGWAGSWRTKYWFWRDRKGLFTNPLSFLTNLLFIAGVVDWTWATLQHRPWAFAVNSSFVNHLCFATASMQVLRLALRMTYTGRLYGFSFAAGVPLRAFLGNLINCCASLRAMWQYAAAKLGYRPLAWLKTEHAYPQRDGRSAHSRPLADVLVNSGLISQARMNELVEELRSDDYLAQVLLARGILPESAVAKAISLQSGVGFTEIDPSRIEPRVLRSLPFHVLQRSRVLPFEVRGGKLLVAGSQVPSAETYDLLQRFTALPVEFHLVTEGNLQNLQALVA